MYTFEITPMAEAQAESFAKHGVDMKTETLVKAFADMGGDIDDEFFSEEELLCSVCGYPIPIVNHGNGYVRIDSRNAYPAADGRCCGSCDMQYVLPARMSKSNEFKVKVDLGYSVFGLELSQALNM